MSSVNSPASGDMDDEDTKQTKAGRGGKRSVSHLSKAQLARKRANDREAQRNIRQRTKEHIENLERKVRQLEDFQEARDGSPATVERVFRRNQELETELQSLRQQLQHASISPPDHDVTDPMLMPKVAWMPSSSSPWHGRQDVAVDSPVPAAASTSFTPLDPSMYASSVPTSIPYLSEATSQGQSQYTATSAPAWDSHDPQHDSGKLIPDWSVPEGYHQHARYAGLQSGGHQQQQAAGHRAGVENVPSAQIVPIAASTSWQHQPSTYAWQITTKLKAPTTFLDQLMCSTIQAQRHLVATGEVSSSDSMPYSYPPVHLLFDQPGPKTASPRTAINNLMAQYSAILSHRRITALPERLASFMCMYRFTQWQINPTAATYQRLHDWQTPRPSQLMIPHAPWMDHPPWGKFRDKIIENQHVYDTPQFHVDFASSTRINWQGDPMSALVFEGGELRASEAMERHLANPANFAMARSFLEKYPEFKEICRVEEI